MNPPNFQLGFQSHEQERQNASLSVEGTVPAWLNGTLVRNGPGKFDFSDGKSVTHWFDGLAMLHSFNFRNGQVIYTCKFLHSKAFTHAQTKGRLSSREFATDPHLGFWQLVWEKPTDNANVNVAKISRSYVAMTETCNTIEFQLDGLTTDGIFKFDDQISGHTTTAHPHFDFSRNCLFNLITKISAQSTYQIYRIDNGRRQRKLLASVSVGSPAYMHSFAMSERFIILAEFPFRLNVPELLFCGKAYIHNYHWHSNESTRFHVFDKNSGSLVATINGAPCFSFHHVNAFDRNEEVILDLLAYDDAAIVNALNLSNLRNDGCELPTAKLQRFVLNLNKKTAASEVICSNALELPRIDYSTHAGRDYSFVYCVGSTSSKNFTDQIVKVNVTTGATNVWNEDDCYPGEPVFVSRSNAEKEDEGVLLSIVLDSKNDNSFLLILDASSMQEQARLRLPDVVAFGFHGQFFGFD